MSVDTEALLATVREALDWALDEHDYGGTENPLAYVREARAALDSLAAELERYKREAHDWQDHADELSERYTAELERVKAERDGFRDEAAEQQMRWLDEQARLDKALAALREIDKMERTSVIAACLKRRLTSPGSPALPSLRSRGR